RASIARYLQGSQVAGQPWAAALKRALERDALDLYGSLDAQERTGCRLEVIVVRFGVAERT
ncbi:MAG TPA: hypothetical protein VFI22_15760, partial [Thermomicrobiales bacterium]|nr:hypothetical protein [Thermomicrobiales bacterium]